MDALQLEYLSHTKMCRRQAWYNSCSGSEVGALSISKCKEATDYSLLQVRVPLLPLLLRSSVQLVGAPERLASEDKCDMALGT